MKIITYAGLPFQDKSIEKKIKQVLNTTTDKEWYRIPTNIIDEHVHEVTENKDCIIIHPTKDQYMMEYLNIIHYVFKKRLSIKLCVQFDDKDSGVENVWVPIGIEESTILAKKNSTLDVATCLHDSEIDTYDSAFRITNSGALSARHIQSKTSVDVCQDNHVRTFIQFSSKYQKPLLKDVWKEVQDTCEQCLPIQIGYKKYVRFESNEYFDSVHKFLKYVHIYDTYNVFVIEKHYGEFLDEYLIGETCQVPFDGGIPMISLKCINRNEETLAGGSLIIMYQSD